MTHRVLVVDDEAGIREALSQVLQYEGWEVETATSGTECLDKYPGFRPHVVILDVKMAGLDGLATLTELQKVEPPATVVMISGHATIDTAVRATQQGAFDFIQKPLDTDRLLVTLRNAVQRSALEGENRELKRALDTRFPMVGTSPALEEVRSLIARVGPANARVLIVGDNGTGKELVARAIHEASPRRDAAFIEINCAAIPSELIESELFGHVKGSFTGAVNDRIGKFELADGGTLFLDEIGDMALPAQAKVLRVLEQGVVTRIGTGRAVHVDVRVLSATNKDLEVEIAEGRFREDLYYRLNVVPIRVPPLRTRLEDIPALVEHFTNALTATTGLSRKSFTPEALAALQQRTWPGNVRELRNAVERLLILSPGGKVSAHDVATILAEVGGRRPEDLVPEALKAGSWAKFKQDAEKAYILVKLREYDWNVTEAARALDIPRSRLYRKMDEFKLSREVK